MSDILGRFTFDKRPIRGEIVSLESSFQKMLASANYPDAIKKLLGELMVATSLLSATVKFEGEITLQIQSEGIVKYAVVGGTNEQKLKGVARWDETVTVFPDTFAELFSKGYLAITLTPKKGQRYQGVVALDKDSLAACLEDYFLQSEQLLTMVQIATDLSQAPKAAGLLLQIIPTTSESSNVTPTIDYEHVTQLANTLQDDELLNLSQEEILTRLYHSDDVRVFPSQTIEFHCDCSRERSAVALKSVNKSELMDIIENEGKVSVDCQFCHANYDFDAIDVENIHAHNLDSGNA